MTSVKWELAGRVLRVTVESGAESRSWTIRPTHKLEQKAEAFAGIAEALGATQSAPQLPRQSQVPPPPLIPQDATEALQRSFDPLASTSIQSNLPSNYGRLKQIERNLRGNSGWAEDEGEAFRAIAGMPELNAHDPQTAAESSNYQLPDVGDPAVRDRIRERPSVFDPQWREKDTR